MIFISFIEDEGNDKGYLLIFNQKKTPGYYCIVISAQQLKLLACEGLRKDRRDIVGVERGGVRRRKRGAVA